MNKDTVKINNSTENKTVKKKMSKRHKVTTVYQIEACECGAASLSMIMSYYGRYEVMEEIRYRCGVTRDGCSAADIITGAEYYGLKVKGYKRTADGLRYVKTPAILHWNFVHFVVLEGIVGKWAYINDPAIGRRKISFAELEDCFTGVVLSCEPGDNFEKKNNDSGFFKEIGRRLSADTKSVLFMVLAGILLVFPGVLIPILTQMFVDIVILEKTSDWMKGLLIAFLGVYLYKALFTYLKSTVLSKLRLKMSLISNHFLMFRMLRLPIRFFTQRSAGELAGRADNNNAVTTFLAGNFSDAIMEFFESLFYLALMVVYNLKLTGCGIAGVIINVIFTILIIKPLEGLNLRYLQNQGLLNANLCAGFSVATSIKANGVEDEYAKGMLNSYARTTDSDQKLGITQQLLGAFPGAFSSVISIVVLAVGGTLIMEGECTAGTLTAFGMLLSSFNGSVNSIISIVQRIQNMKAAMARISDVDNTGGDRRFYSEKEDCPVEKFRGKVEVKNLSFGYNPSLDPVVRDINFTIEPGSRVAIVGSSGCGKSTLGKLITGIQHPWEGEVLIDGISIDRIPQPLLCESLSVINQDALIFSGTVKDNITLWNKRYTAKSVLEAVRDADAYQMIEGFKDGYDYVLSESGNNLSGGQRQKLEIARALVKNPSIILMDEATSAMDAVTEQIIVDNIRKRGCTCIIVAHRLSSIKNCDLILVMDEGRIVQYGTHESLMKVDGIYKELIGA